jgi:hypothetical protein
MMYISGRKVGLFEWGLFDYLFTLVENLDV